MSEAPLQKICVYCGSAPGRDPRFADGADLLGKALAQAGLGLVYGGGDRGLMGRIARATLDHGGHVTGIIPAFLQKREHMLHDAQEVIVVDDMHTRKRLMFEHSDAFVALPGGIGTLEELVEQMTWSQLGQHDKPIVIADLAGFWRPLLSLLDHMRGAGFIREEWPLRYLVADEAEAVVPTLQAALETNALLGRTRETLDPRF